VLVPARLLEAVGLVSAGVMPGLLPCRVQAAENVLWVDLCLLSPSSAAANAAEVSYRGDCDGGQPDAAAGAAAL
jgi:hypothetical protein